MDRKNNFDFIRLVFASFVVITHSYILCGLPESEDFLFKITRGFTAFSYIGVRGFFIISGFLIFQSLQRSQTLVEYYWKRLVRLFPALFVVLLLTVLLAPFVYDDHVIPYLHNKMVWTYIPNNLLLYTTQFAISGVFDNNPYKYVINGSLWTIPYEFTLYIILSSLFFCRHQIKILPVILCTVAVLMIIANIFLIQKNVPVNDYILLDLGVFFITGSAIASTPYQKLQGSNFWLILFVVLFILSFLNIHAFIIGRYILLPFVIILFGLKSTPIINNIGNKIGDLSYGIYIYGFPVQQTLVHFFKLNYSQLMLGSLGITFLLAYLSWHLIEAKALQFKKIKWLNKFQKQA